MSLPRGEQDMMKKLLLFLMLAGLLLPRPLSARAQDPAPPAQSSKKAPAKKPAKAPPAKQQPATVTTSGLYGLYPLSRESSGTSWQPESSPAGGVQESEGESMFLLRGYLYGIYDDQQGPRGNSKTFIENMFALTVRQGMKNGTLGFRVMLSLDPTQGNRGYPLLFQTGEQANGEPLIDRQFPHDFFSELAVTYSVPADDRRSFFVYAGLPGEPALGPPAFVNRYSGAFTNPEAPLGYRWIDSTHISYGVLTVGYILDRLKLEASSFRGREPDDRHWNIESPKLDSYAGRITYNTSRNLSLQASYGWLRSPEELFPDVDIGRYTASLLYNVAKKNVEWQTTFAWGLNSKRPGKDTNALLLESAVTAQQKHTVFGRLERVEKDDLFLPGDPLAGSIFTVGKASIGYSYRFLQWKQIGLDAGGLMSAYAVPGELQPVYGDSPFSYMLFVKAQFI